MSAEIDRVDPDAPDGDERYGLTWVGKRAAVRSLRTPTVATLRPVPEASVDFDAARNVFVEGDNLDVLKLLRGAYAGAVKLSYIDPPYNTGNGFVYDDRFAGGRQGHRRHSRWLSMMYPRLALARELLTSDGVLAVSIDSNEYARLTLLLDELFGEENHLTTFVWAGNLKGRQISGGGAVGTHEYIVCYARDAARVGQFRGSLSRLSALMPAVYRPSSYPVKHDARGPYVTKNELHNTNSKFNERTAPTMVFRIHYHPETAEVRVTDIDDEQTFPGFLTAMPHPNARLGLQWHAWRWSRGRVLADRDDLEFAVTGGRLRIRTKVRDVDSTAVKDLIVGPSIATAQADLKALGLGGVFETPKPVALLQLLVATATGPDDLVLDFFAGSGSTAHAVAVQNAQDGGRRGCISVNLPEPVPPDSTAARAGFATVSEITLARLRKVLEVVPGAEELGLRVLRVVPGGPTAPETVG